MTPGTQKMEVAVPNRGTEKHFVYGEGTDGTLKKTEETLTQDYYKYAGSIKGTNSIFGPVRAS